MAEIYDLIVIGGGSAGLVAASGSALLGAKVALIEKNLLGGDCLYTGCVPSKTLIKSAKFAHQARSAKNTAFRI
jgi:pyruvate/2-oxoglutarate dehydrogenase complex dihydrolipoamide dehydrogenase (E3) component